VHDVTAIARRAIAVGAVALTIATRVHRARVRNGRNVT
jgi:hypothetical protein